MSAQELRLQADAAKQGVALKLAQLEAEAHKLKQGMATCLQARQQGLASQQQDLRKELAALQVRGPEIIKKADCGGTACVSLPLRQASGAEP